MSGQPIQYAVQRDSYSPKRRRRWLFLAVAAIAAAIIAGLIMRFSGTNRAVIAPQSSPAAQAKPVSYKVLKGKYITFTYNGEYSVKPMQASDNDLELYMLSADTSYDKHIAVAVSRLPGGDLDNYASYNYRKTTPNLYSTRSVSVDGAAASEWLKNDGSEITVFIPRGNTVATLSFVTGDALEQLQPEVNAVLQSFRWQ